MSWNNEKVGWIKIKEGDVKELTIEDIVEKQPSGKIQPIPGKSYYYEFKTSEGNLTVNNLGLFAALVTNKVRKGDRIRIKYVKKGTLGNPSRFEIDILKKAEEIDIDKDFDGQF